MAQGALRDNRPHRGSQGGQRGGNSGVCSHGRQVSDACSGSREAEAAANAAKHEAETIRASVPESSRAYGVWICGAAIGDDEYVAAKLKEIQDELCGPEDVTQTDGDGGSLGVLQNLSLGLANEDPHAAHSAVLYSLQNRIDWILSVHLPSETRGLARAVDMSIRKSYAHCFGWDPFDPDSMPYDAPLLDPSFVADRFIQKTRNGGGGFRPTEKRALFLNTFNTVAPQLLGSGNTAGLWTSLETVLGAGSFDDANQDQRWTAFYNSGSRYGEELKAEWLRLKQDQLAAAHAAGIETPPASVLDADVCAFGHKEHNTAAEGGLRVRAWTAARRPCRATMLGAWPI